MQLGNYQLRKFDGIDASFGASLADYPNREIIPEDHRSGRSRGCAVFSSFFFGGGKLEDHGLRLKADVDPQEFFPALHALMSSFAPPHELKEATCGWLIEEHTEELS